MSFKSSFSKPHYVYAFEDFDTLDIVYIGCTCNIIVRRRLHFSDCKGQTNTGLKEYLLRCKDEKKWPKFKILGTYKNFEDAHKVEKLLIKNVHPKFNIHSNN